MAANSIIEQRPLYRQLPVGQEVVFVVSNSTAVANELKVKFIAQVHISNTTTPNLANTNDLIGTFKTTPNNAGVGIFDFRNIIENYVKADNMAADGSEYKGDTTTSNLRTPLHLIDKYSLNNNTARYMAVKFEVEYLGADDGVNPVDTNIVRTQVGTHANSLNFLCFNGYLKQTDVLTLSSSYFGFSLLYFLPRVGAPVTTNFLTNTPTTQYANLEDYGTLSYLVATSLSSLGGFDVNGVSSITITYYDSAGGSLGSPDVVTRDTANGAYDVWDSEVNKQIMHFGCYPANLQNWSTTFQGLVTAGTIEGGYYTIIAKDASGDQTIKTYTINVNCPNTKGYESIRLCWLNQWGAWDYYTFTKKSVQSISTKGSTYQQLAGTWNEGVYRVDSYKGGKKAFRVNATEKITMNTGFVNEDENVIFEELINSPEVYLLHGFQTDIFTSFNQYVIPARLTTSSFTRKTIANDRLMQYTFEVEKSKTLRTQSV